MRLRLDPSSPSGVSAVLDQPAPVRSAPGYVVNKATGLITAGTNVSITGNGTSENPYEISATGGGGGGATDATTSVKGIVQLAGDLGGTAALPTVKSRMAYKTVSRNATDAADYTCDGTADDVEIQAAINSLGSRGGVVYIKSSANAYRIASTITMPGNVWLVGEKQTKSNSNGGVVFQTAASTSLTSVISMTGTSATLLVDAKIENIVINGNSTTTYGIKLVDVDTVKIIDCRLINSTNSILSDWDGTSAPAGAAAPGGLWVERCQISALSGGYGVILNYNTQCWFANNWHTGTSVAGWFRIKCSNKIYIAGSEFNTATTAILLEDVNDGSGLALGCHNIAVFAKTFATGGTVVTDNRTHSTSDYVHLAGTVASGTTQGSTLVGSHNTVTLTSGAVLTSLTLTNPMAQSNVTNLTTDLAAKAPLASPALTGTPTAPTASPNTNSTQIATTAYTDAAISALVGTAPGVLDTLGEISDAINDDANLYTTLSTSIAGKSSLTAANTHTAGTKNTFSQSATTAGFNLGNVSGDPSSPAAGDMWFNSASGWKFYTGSATRIIVTRDATDTLTNKTISGASNTLSNIAQSSVTNLVSDLAAKQATLVSGTNIKTVNGNTLLGSGDIVISGGGSTTLAGLTDISLSGLADGQILKYDNTAGVWYNDIIDFSQYATLLYVTGALGTKADDSAVLHTRVVVTTSGNYTAASTANTDHVYLIAGLHTTTLPAASGNKNRYTFKNNHSANVTVSRAGTDTVEGATSLTLSPGSSIDLISDGTSAWYVI